ncbi:MAG: hypothetical protein IJA61_02115 [Clostridia bacterium]|nr:hypothetical protein [Clostridia bacterium]
MTKKAKVIVAVVAAFLVLVIAGLAVGLVLVAQQVQMTNSVSVTYVANNVDCNIQSYAIHHIAEVENSWNKTINLNSIDTAKMEIVQVKDGEIFVNSVTDEIRAYNTNTDGKDYLEKTRTFNEVTLRPVAASDTSTTSSVVMYYFEITNNAPSGGKNLYVGYTWSPEATTDDNVYITCDMANGISAIIVQPGEMGIVRFSIKIDDISKNANWSGNLKLTIEQTDLSGFMGTN